MEALLACSRDVLIHYAPDHRALHVSGGIHDLLGWNPLDLMGTFLPDLVHPDDLRAFADEEAPSRADTPHRPPLTRYRLRTAAGEYVWVSGRSHAVSPDDPALGRAVILRDVSDEVREIEAQRAASAAAASSEKRFRLAMDASAIGMCLVAPAGRLLRVNPALCTMLGRTSEDLLSATWQELTHPDDLNTDLELVADVLAGRRDTYRLNKRYLRSDGTVVWGDLSVACVRNDAGDVEQFVSQIVDVTAQHAAHEALASARQLAEEREERSQAVLDSLLDPHVLLHAVRDEMGTVVDFVYVDANQAACDYTRLNREQLIGARLLELLPGQASSGMLSVYIKALSSGEPLVLDDFAYPNELIGSERRYDIRAVGVRDGVSLTWRDVTERHQTAHRLVESEAHYRLLADNSSDVVLHVRHSIVLWVSPSLRDVLGWSVEEWTGHDVVAWVHPADRQQLTEQLATVDSGIRVHSRFRLRATTGVFHWVDATAHRFVNDAGRVDGIAASFSLADAQVAAEQALAHRAHHDQLTGLLNRAALFDKLHNLLPQATEGGKRVAFAFCDLDSFKTINDTHGHQMGDHVITTAAAHITAMLNPRDVAARLGGDEFLLLFRDVDGIDDAVLRAERVREHCEQPHDYGGITYRPLISIGVTIAHPGEAVDDVIARADRAMYEAKQAGGNRVVSAG